MTSPTVVSRRRRGAPFMISATSVEVPPTSTVSRFGNPACSATQSAPVTPPAGPDISRFTGYSSAEAADARPPSERRMCSFTSPAFEASLLREVAHVALHDRAHVGVRDGRHRALVLLHLGHDLGGERHRHARQHAPAISRMRRSCASFAKALISETVSASIFAFFSFASESRSCGLVEAAHHGAARIHALVGLDRERERRHRQRLVVDHPAAEAARHVGARDLQHLAVALGRHQPDLRAGARQHGVGRDGRAVHHVVDRARLRCRRACRCGRGPSARRPTGPSACSAPWRSRCGRSSRRPAGGR